MEHGGTPSSVRGGVDEERTMTREMRKAASLSDGKAVTRMRGASTPQAGRGGMIPLGTKRIGRSLVVLLDSYRCEHLGEVVVSRGLYETGGEARCGYALVVV
jgi:hypothetical protein